MKASLLGGLIGSMMGVLLGAAAFRSGAPVDARFTYQGQIRDGDALITGNADVRFTLWDALEGGGMVGSVVTRTNLPVTDGRFATELDFGASAFSGDARWIQMEVRTPAGSGQYSTLLPRQRVNAVPYALYSLNGGLSPWNLDVSTRDIGYVNGKVGIGTNAPTAALEVVSATGGDESVRLPVGSVGAAELASGIISYGVFGANLLAQNGQAVSKSLSFAVANDGVISFNGQLDSFTSGPFVYRILLDGRKIYETSIPGSLRWRQVEDLRAGSHLLEFVLVDQFDISGWGSEQRLDVSVSFGTGRIQFE